ncbi:hypothetical protein D3C86_1882360 [compost metagenome]
MYFPQIEKHPRVTRSVMRDMEAKEVCASRLKGKKNHPARREGWLLEVRFLVGSATKVAVTQTLLGAEYRSPIVGLVCIAPQWAMVLALRTALRRA